MWLQRGRSREKEPVKSRGDQIGLHLKSWHLGQGDPQYCAQNSKFNMISSQILNWCGRRALIFGSRDHKNSAKCQFFGRESLVKKILQEKIPFHHVNW